MKILVTIKNDVPYCQANNEKTIYRAIKRGLDKHNDDYILHMHPRFLHNLTELTICQIYQNSIEVICKDEYELIIEDKFLYRLPKEAIEDLAFAGIASPNIGAIGACMYYGFTEKYDDTHISIIVNQASIDKIISKEYIIKWRR